MSTASETTITVEYPTDARFSVVGRLIVGGLASRFELPVDRIDDLLLATETLSRHAFAGDRVSLEADAGEGALVVRLGPFPTDPLKDAGTSRVIRPLVDTVGTEQRDGSGHWVQLSLTGTHRPSGG